MRSFFYDINRDSPTQKPNVTDTVAIGQMIEDFIGTRKGQRFFDPTYGVSLEDSLFELIDEQNAIIIFSQLTIQVEENIPVVKVDTSRSSIIPDYERLTYTVEVAYFVDGATDVGYTKPITLGAA